MTKFSIFTGAMLLVLSLKAQDFKLKNADFSEGTKNWIISKDIKNSDITGNTITFDLPKCKSRYGKDFLVQILKLKPNNVYRLKFSVESEKTGILIVKYGQTVWPWDNLGLLKEIDLKGAKKYIIEYDFIARQNYTKGQSLFSFSYKKLTGKIKISNLELIEVPLFSARNLIGQDWQAFIGVKRDNIVFDKIPDSINGKSPELINFSKDKENTINFASLNDNKFEPQNSIAVVYNKFNSTKKGMIGLSISADWWLDIYNNGNKVISTTGTIPLAANRTIFIPVNKGKNVLAFIIRAGSKGWRFFFKNSQSGAKKISHYKANDKWKAANMINGVVKKGSALDLSSYIHKPAGKFGRLTVAPNGKLVFAEQPNKNVILMAQNFNAIPISPKQKDIRLEEFKKYVKEYVLAARNQGYNLFRIHTLDGCLKLDKYNNLNRDNLERLDFLLAEMKKAGIYAHLTLFSYYFGFGYRAAHNEFKTRYLMGDKEIRNQFKLIAKQLLEHVNPYTNVAWKDEPSIAFMECFNELQRSLKIKRRFKGADAMILPKWRKWLSQKYTNKLMNKKLQKELKDTKLSEAPLPESPNTQLATEYEMFRVSYGLETQLWGRKILRDNGYKGIIPQFTLWKSYGGNLARWQTSPIVVSHTYQSHPSGYVFAGTIVNQKSSMGKNPAAYWRWTSYTKLSGRPIMVTEYNHCFWNPYFYEAGILFGTYSALQNYATVTIHTDIVKPKIENKGLKNAFHVGESAVMRANQFLTACLLARGDVKPSKHEVILSVSKQALENGLAPKAIGDESLLSLLSGFAVAFPDYKPINGLKANSKPDMIVQPSGGALETSHDYFVNVGTYDGDFSITKAVEEMRKRNILPVDNITNPEKGVYQSDTGEITIFSEEKKMTVVTPKTEAVALLAGKKQQLKNLTVNHSSENSSIAVCSVDGNPIETSSRMVLLYITNEVNSNMVVNRENGELIHIGYGDGPLLLSTGKLSLELKNSNADKLSLYALSFDGSRREKIPVSFVDSKLKINLDTAKLAKGPTTFFELVKE